MEMYLEMVIANFLCMVMTLTHFLKQSSQY